MVSAFLIVLILVAGLVAGYTITNATSSECSECNEGIDYGTKLQQIQNSIDNIGTMSCAPTCAAVGLQVAAIPNYSPALTTLQTSVDNIDFNACAPTCQALKSQMNTLPSMLSPSFNAISIPNFSPALQAIQTDTQHIPAIQADINAIPNYSPALTTLQTSVDNIDFNACAPTCQALKSQMNTLPSMLSPSFNAIQTDTGNIPAMKTDIASILGFGPTWQSTQTDIKAIPNYSPALTTLQTSVDNIDFNACAPTCQALKSQMNALPSQVNTVLSPSFQSIQSDINSISIPNYSPAFQMLQDDITAIHTETNLLPSMQTTLTTVEGNTTPVPAILTAMHNDINNIMTGLPIIGDNQLALFTYLQDEISPKMIDSIQDFNVYGVPTSKPTLVEPGKIPGVAPIPIYYLSESIV